MTAAYSGMYSVQFCCLISFHFRTKSSCVIFVHTDKTATINIIASDSSFLIKKENITHSINAMHIKFHI